MAYGRTDARHVTWLLFLGMSGRHKRPQGRFDCHPIVGRSVRPILINLSILWRFYAATIFQRIWVKDVGHQNPNCILILLLSLHFYSVAGAMGICFPYLGEFQPTKYREKILCWMEMFWTMGIIALPGCANWNKRIFVEHLIFFFF